MRPTPLPEGTPNTAATSGRFLTIPRVHPFGSKSLRCHKSTCGCKVLLISVSVSISIYVPALCHLFKISWSFGYRGYVVFVLHLVAVITKPHWIIKFYNYVLIGSKIYIQSLLFFPNYKFLILGTQKSNHWRLYVATSFSATVVTPAPIFDSALGPTNFTWTC